MLALPAACLAVSLGAVEADSAPHMNLSAAVESMVARHEQTVVQVISHRPWSPQWGVQPAPRDARGRYRTLFATGAVVDREGHLLTCADFAQPIDSIVVRLANGEIRAAQFVSQDGPSGVSLLHVESAAGLVPVTCPKTDFPVREGDCAVVLSFDAPKVEAHIASLERILPGAPQGSPAHLLLEMAGTNGACGGLVLDGTGAVFGMIVDCGVEPEIDAGTADASMLPRDFHPRAIARGKILQVADRLKANTAHRVGFLGVQAEEAALASSDAERIELSAPVGVVRVLPDSPAALAGVLVGDRIVSFNGRPVTGVQEVSDWISQTPLGQQVHLVLLREGRHVSIDATIADRSMLEWMERRAVRRVMARKQLQREIDLLQRDLDRLAPPVVPD
jgi:serine protease Do